ncbi:MAG: diacylglycerol/polyprenol kinase family protein [Alphaproteobacteria bacterium]|jgi:dolichol kinase
MEISYRQEVLRKLVHLSSLWMTAAIYFLHPIDAAILFSVLLAVNITVEYGFHKGWPVCRAIYGRFFGKMLRDGENASEFHLSGAPYVLMAALDVVVIFPKLIAMISLSVMLIGDTAAALFGRKFGRHKINGGRKSVEGAAAFFVASTVVLVFFIVLFDLPLRFFIAGVVGIFAAMLAEIYEKQLRLDDNFSITLCVALALTAAL